MAKTVTVIIIAVAGPMLAFGEVSDGVHDLIQIGFGLSNCFATSSVFLPSFTFSGRALARWRDGRSAAPTTGASLDNAFSEQHIGCKGWILRLDAAASRCIRRTWKRRRKELRGMVATKIGMKGRRSLPSIDTVPGYKKVAQMIEAEIVEGRLKVGELLPTEGDLADQLGVHRSTAREGIRALENAGLVRRVGAKRLMVSVPDSSSLAWVNSRAMGLRKVSFRELWELQMELEPFAAQLAAQRISDDIGDLLQLNLQSLEANIEDDHAIIANDIAFHMLIAKAADNKALSLSVAPIGVLLFSATENLYQKVPQARHRLLQAHKIIAEAVLRHDAEAARLWMTKHIRDFKRGYEAGGLDIDTPIKVDPHALRS